MFDAWACACPVILGIDGEAREVMEEAKAGVFVEPEDAGQLAEVIRRLKQDPEQLQRYGRHGRLFVVAHFSRQCLAARLEALLLEIVEGTTG
jgi:glycosyltransferase involved in cell wall biosynthesis